MKGGGPVLRWNWGWMVVCSGGGHWIFDLSGPLGVDEVRTVVAGGEEVWQARRERACDTWSGEEDTGACYDGSRKDEFTLMNDSPLQIAAITSSGASPR